MATSARWLRRLFNVYPPFLGAGVHVREVADDFRRIRVEMPLRWYNRNYVGTHFGGSLFAMTDPFLMIMFMRNLGPEFLVWDRASCIEFLAPGRGTMTAEFAIGDAELADVRQHTAGGAKYEPWFEAEVRAADGTVVARVRKQIYFRRKRPREAAGQ